jgi:hypothetical protein
MTKYCCVPGCKETGGFQFPADPLLRKGWCIAVRRQTKSKKLWTPSKHSVVCKKHFREEDFAKSPIERLRRDLVKGAVPSIFEFGKNKSPEEELAISARQQRNKQRHEAVSQHTRSENLDVETEESSVELSCINDDTTLDENEMFFQFDLYGKLTYILAYKSKNFGCFLNIFSALVY